MDYKGYYEYTFPTTNGTVTKGITCFRAFISDEEIELMKRYNKSEFFELDAAARSFENVRKIQIFGWLTAILLIGFVLLYMSEIVFDNAVDRQSQAISYLRHSPYLIMYPGFAFHLR